MVVFSMNVLNGHIALNYCTFNACWVNRFISLTGIIIITVDYSLKNFTINNVSNLLLQDVKIYNKINNNSVKHCIFQIINFDVKNVVKLNILQMVLLRLGQDQLTNNMLKNKVPYHLMGKTKQK